MAIIENIGKIFAACLHYSFSALRTETTPCIARTSQ